ncbi:MAG: TIGR04053 family radical SAM/SPASM domain-containing protein [Haloferacaceae archaeon]
MHPPDRDRSTGGRANEQTGGRGTHGPNFDRAPLVVTWEVTQACDLACDHCRADARPERHPDELSTTEGRRLVDEVAAFGDEPGPGPVLVFSGGDPLKRPDVFELVSYATDSGVPAAVTPAPTALLDRTAIERFAEAGARRMALSLDGATAESHDAFRGEEGSFETIRRAAREAETVGLPLQVNTTVTAATVEELPEIADLVASFGAVMWEVFFLVPVGRGTELEGLDPGRVDEVLAWLYRRSRDASFRVVTVEAPRYRPVARRVEREAGSGDADSVRVGSTGDGDGFVFVSHTGDVYPSGFLPERVGNVRESSLTTLYRESPLLRALRDPDSRTGACGACPHRSLCGGSRARAYATTGDPLGSDPLCPRGAAGGVADD